MTKTQKKIRAKKIKLQQKKIHMVNKIKEEHPPVPVIETKNSQFVAATLRKIFDEDQYNYSNYRSIVDANNLQRVFAIVTVSYKLVQHQQVLDKVEERIKKLELTHVDNIISVNDGARVRIETNFPKVYLDLENGERITCQCDWDNSYDLSTGLRMILKGVQINSNPAANGKNRQFVFGDKWAYFYGKHTKNLDLNDLGDKLEEALDIFKTKVLEKFHKMLHREITLADALNFLDTCVEEKTIASTYLTEIQKRLTQTDQNEMRSQFDLYKLISDVLTIRVESVDAHLNHAKKMDDKMRKHFK